jgi:transcriptional regulator with XRE-family HTH domain
MQEFEQKYLNILSQKLRILRENAGLSQEVMGEKVDCTREFINRVENRKEDVSLKMLLKLAYVLNVSPQTFFED